jgi:hypothetical protein
MFAPELRFLDRTTALDGSISRPGDAETNRFHTGSDAPRQYVSHRPRLPLTKQRVLPRSQSQTKGRGAHHRTRLRRPARRRRRTCPAPPAAPTENRKPTSMDQRVNHRQDGQTQTPHAMQLTSPSDWWELKSLVAENNPPPALLCDCSIT